MLIAAWAWYLTRNLYPSTTATGTNKATTCQLNRLVQHSTAQWAQKSGRLVSSVHNIWRLYKVRLITHKMLNVGYCWWWAISRRTSTVFPCSFVVTPPPPLVTASRCWQTYGKYDVQRYLPKNIHAHPRHFTTYSAFLFPVFLPREHLDGVLVGETLWWGSCLSSHSCIATVAEWCGVDVCVIGCHIYTKGTV